MVPYNTVLPSEQYNTLMICVTFLTMLWSFKALKRLYFMFRIRSTVLTDRIIQVRGLGSYLSYFEGATQAHINAIVHTRQTKPPVTMNIAYFPFTVNDASLVRINQTQYNMEFSLSTTVNCKVVLLFNFKSAHFVSMVAKFRKLNNGLISEDGSSQLAFLENLLQVGTLSTTASGLYDKPQQTTNIMSSSSSSRGGTDVDVKPSYPLNQSGSAQYECLLCEVAAGTHLLSLSLSDIMSSVVESMVGVAVSAATPTAAVGSAIALDGDGNPVVGSSTSAPSRGAVEESLCIALLLVPNVSVGGNHSRFGKGGRQIDSELPHITRPQRSTAATGTLSLAMPSGSSGRPSATNGLEMSPVDESPSPLQASSASANWRKMPVTPTAGDVDLDGDVESGGAQLGDGMRSSTDGNPDDSLIKSPKGAAWATGSGDEGRSNRDKNKRKKNGDSAALQESAPVCSAVFSYSVPFSQFVSSRLPSVGALGPPQTDSPLHGKQKKGARLSETAHKRVVQQTEAANMAVSEVLVLDQMGNLFASQEIFGLNSAAPANKPEDASKPAEILKSASTVAKPADGVESFGGSQSSGKTSRSAGTTATAAPEQKALDPHRNNNSSAIACGGKFVEEDCVVCLTDPKEISLLPCRHLCVCTSCLIYIDKCPVCRAPFSEYVVIQSKSPMFIDIPSNTTNNDYEQ